MIYCSCLDVFYPTTDPQLFLQSIRKTQSLDINRILPAHHKISVPIDIIDRIENAFTKLDDEENLQQGKAYLILGTFRFIFNIGQDFPVALIRLMSVA